MAAAVACGHDGGAGQPAGASRRRRRGPRLHRVAPASASAAASATATVAGHEGRTACGVARRCRGRWLPSRPSAPRRTRARPATDLRMARVTALPRRRRPRSAAPSPASTCRRRSRPLPRRWAGHGGRRDAPVRGRIRGRIRGDRGHDAARHRRARRGPLRADAVVGQSRRPQPAGHGADGPALHGGRRRPRGAADPRAGASRSAWR